MNFWFIFPVIILKICIFKSFVLFGTDTLLDQPTAWKVSKYAVISGPYFPVVNPNTGKYGPEITPYLDTFDAVVLKFPAHLSNLTANG